MPKANVGPRGLNDGPLGCGEGRELARPRPRLCGQRRESGRQVVHPSLRNRRLPVGHVTARCEGQVIEMMAPIATGMRGTRLGYQELIAPNGHQHGARPTR